MSEPTPTGAEPVPPSIARYRRLLLTTAGLGGLLYGIDVGIIAGALPYLEATSGLNAGQLSIIVAAVLLGSVVAGLVAGLLADLIGRRPLMIVAGAVFVASIPLIALADGFMPLLFGRLLQGISAGLIGVAIPLYLAECLGAANRGKGTGVFQWLLTLGILVAALIALWFSHRVEQVAEEAKRLGDPSLLFAMKDAAWRGIFWASLPPGVLFVLGCLLLSESPRWLHRRGRIDAARQALLRARTPAETEAELAVMTATSLTSDEKHSRGSLLQRRYVIPFLLACAILACTQLTGVNSILGYNATILLQAGLGDVQAHWGYVIMTAVNFLLTIGSVLLVDRKGRKFLLSLGSAGIVVSLALVGVLFQRTEAQRVDVREALQAQVTAEQSASLAFDQAAADRLLASASERGAAISGRPATLIVIYSYGDFRAATAAVRSDDAAAKPLTIARDASLPPNAVVAFFSNPAGDLTGAKTAPLKIEHALITPVPSPTNGWLTALCLFAFMAFFAVGPGVCVWLALSELMPTRIRSNGMSIALFVNQAVSTTIAATFLPTVGAYGYATMFFVFAGCTVIYFLIAAFLLPETKGRTLEEIEQHFAKRP